MKRALLTLLLCPLAGIAFSLAGGAANAEGNGGYAPFIRTAIQKWDDYVRDISKMEWTVVTSIDYGPGAGKENETTCIFNFPNFVMEQKKDGVLKRVNGYGKKYSFLLEHDSETGHLEINSVSQNRSIPQPSLLTGFFHGASPSKEWWLSAGGRHLGAMSQPLTLYGFTTLQQLFTFQDFSISSLTEDGEKYYIDYTFEPPEPEQPVTEADAAEFLKSDFPETPVRSGRLVLLKESYLPESIEFSLETGTLEEGQVITEHAAVSCVYEQVEGKTVLKSKKFVISGDGDPRTTLWTYGNVSFQKEPASRFTLSYYGLPEPEFKNGFISPANLRGALIFAGCCLIVLSVLFRLYRKRQAAQ